MRPKCWGIALTVVAVLGLGTFSRAQDPSADSWDARVVSVSGSVTFYPASSPNEALAAVPDLPLENGDRIVTNSNGVAQLAFNGSGVVGLSPNSSFTVSSLAQSKTVFSLAWGNMIAKFDALFSGQNLQVETPTAVAAVRGTEFGVGFSKKKGADFGVFDEGKVEVTNHSGSEYLKPHQEVSVRSKSGRLARPHALKHFLRYRSKMKNLRARIAKIHLHWKKKDPFRTPGPSRKEIREKLLGRMSRLGEGRKHFHSGLRERRMNRRRKGGQLRRMNPSGEGRKPVQGRERIRRNGRNRGENGGQ